MTEIAEGPSRPRKTPSFVWQRRFRIWHRRLAVITALQLLLWTVSGVYFAFIDIKAVRGEPHRRALPVLSIDLSQFDFPVTATSQLLESQTGISRSIEQAKRDDAAPREPL